MCPPLICMFLFLGWPAEAVSMDTFCRNFEHSLLRVSRSSIWTCSKNIRTLGFSRHTFAIWSYSLSLSVPNPTITPQSCCENKLIFTGLTSWWTPRKSQGLKMQKNKFKKSKQKKFNMGIQSEQQDETKYWIAAQWTLTVLYTDIVVLWNKKHVIKQLMLHYSMYRWGSCTNVVQEIIFWHFLILTTWLCNLSKNYSWHFIRILMPVIFGSLFISSWSVLFWSFVLFNAWLPLSHRQFLFNTWEKLIHLFWIMERWGKKPLSFSHLQNVKCGGFFLHAQFKKWMNSDIFRMNRSNTVNRHSHYF